MNLALRPCSQPGCRALVQAGRCAEHNVYRQQTASRGKTAERGYDADFRRLRVQCFTRDNWQCVECNWRPRIIDECIEIGVPLPPTEIVLEHLRKAFNRGEQHLHCDHRLTVQERPDLRLSLGNLQTLCRSCHSKKSRQEATVGYIQV